MESLYDLIYTHVTCQELSKIVMSLHFCCPYLAFPLLKNSEVEQHGKGILGSMVYVDRNYAELTIGNQT